MPTTSDERPDLSRWKKAIDRYAAWVGRENAAEAKLWNKELRNGSPEQMEGRTSEAVAWEWLNDRPVDEIRAGLGSPGKSADFHCRIGRDKFKVEVVNISRRKMTEITGQQDREPAGTFRYVGASADEIHQTLSSKAKQGANSEQPYLVFVTTLHANGSILLRTRLDAENVLTSTPFLQVQFEESTGASRDELKLKFDLKHSISTKTGSLVPARTCISGALIGGFGTYPGVSVLGILHSAPIHPFDPGLLPDTPFASAKLPSSEDPRIYVEWSDGWATES